MTSNYSSTLPPDSTFGAAPVLDPALHTLLDSYPAASELYENVNYRYAGLCRSPLDWALGAEQQARQAIERAMRQPNQGDTDVQI